MQGATQGLVRLSLAKRPDPGDQETVPGMGVKILRDGTDSANLVAMESVDGQKSWNFFKHDFSNHIPKTGFSFLPVAIKFATATKNIRQVGLSDWAKRGQDGAEVADPVFPYRLRFRTTGKLAFPDTYVRPNPEQLTSIPGGSTLYEVVALDQPEELGGQESHIADLLLVGGMVTSGWADSRLFFRHQDMADDLRARPEWNRFTPKFEWGDDPSPVGKSRCH